MLMPKVWTKRPTLLHTIQSNWQLHGLLLISRSDYLLQEVT